MEEIKMVDLASQHRRIKDELDKAVQEVIDTTAFIRGPQVKSFEKNLAAYTGAKHAISCGNGTDALQIALMALDLPAGAEVITPDFTFVATAEVAELLGYKTVLVDVDPDTFTIDINKLRKAITPKTKVIIPVHLFGLCADMDAIMDIAKEHNLYVVEDTAQAIGTVYTFRDGRKAQAGTIGHIGTTSFFPSKNLGCMGDGGALFTNDDALAHKISTIANHGQGHQYHYEMIGVNSRLDTIQAAVLDVKLRYLNEFIDRRQKAAKAYDEAFKGNANLQTPKWFERSNHTFHQYTLKVLNGRRDELINYLSRHNVPAKVYYPIPLHKHETYSQLGSAADLAVSAKISEQVLSLPMHTELTEDQIQYITQTVNNFFTA